jgi:hypothetical protein
MHAGSVSIATAFVFCAFRYLEKFVCVEHFAQVHASINISCMC